MEDERHQLESDGRIEYSRSSSRSIVIPVALFERHQERLPPVLLSDGWLNYDEIPWNATFGLQTQIKRASDICLALLLLLISSPLIAAAMAWIWIDDPGPIFFRQVRTGLMGIPFSS